MNERAQTRLIHHPTGAPGKEQCDRNGQITFSTRGTLCLGGDYYCHSFNGLAWTSTGSANEVRAVHISIAIRGPARQQQVGD